MTLCSLCAFLYNGGLTKSVPLEPETIKEPVTDDSPQENGQADQKCDHELISEDVQSKLVSFLTSSRSWHVESLAERSQCSQVTLQKVLRKFGFKWESGKIFYDGEGKVNQSIAANKNDVCCRLRNGPPKPTTGALKAPKISQSLTNGKTLVAKTGLLPELLHEQIDADLRKDRRIQACEENLATYNRYLNDLGVDLLQSTLVIGEQTFHLAGGHKKRMLVVLMDYDGIVSCKFLGSDYIFSDQYRGILVNSVFAEGEWLDRKLASSKSLSKKFVLYHDNHSGRKAEVIREYINHKQERIRSEKGIDFEVLEWKHPPYSDDLNPVDFNCLPVLAKYFDKKYNRWSELETDLTKFVQLNGHKFQGVRRLPERWNKVASNGGQLDKILPSNIEDTRILLRIN